MVKHTVRGTENTCSEYLSGQVRAGIAGHTAPPLLAGRETQWTEARRRNKSDCPFRGLLFLGTSRVRALLQVSLLLQQDLGVEILLCSAALASGHHSPAPGTARPASRHQYRHCWKVKAWWEGAREEHKKQGRARTVFPGLYFPEQQAASRPLCGGTIGGSSL